MQNEHMEVLRPISPADSEDERIQIGCKDLMLLGIQLRKNGDFLGSIEKFEQAIEVKISRQFLLFCII